MYYVYEKNKRSIFISIISLLIALISVIVALVVFLDRKKKKEDKEIDDYLDNSIM